MEILYKDDFLVAIYKPAGIPALPERSGPRGKDALAWIRQQVHPQAHLLHRLDKPTSGILLASWDKATFEAVFDQFAHHTVEKKYWAIVEGRANFDTAELNVPISPEKRKADPFAGKTALTIAHTQEHFRRHTLVLCIPITGRPHQVRIHLSYYGHPIVNDTIYGGRPLYLSSFHSRYKPDARYPEKPLHPENIIFLHAGYLRFFHPRLGKPLTLESAAPKHFQIALRQLRKYSSV